MGVNWLPKSQSIDMIGDSTSKASSAAGHPMPAPGNFLRPILPAMSALLDQKSHLGTGFLFSLLSFVGRKSKGE